MKKPIDLLNSSLLEDIDVIIFDLDGTLYPLYQLKFNLIALAFRHPIAGYKFFRARTLMRKVNYSTDTFTSRANFLLRQAELVHKTPKYFDKYIYRYIDDRPFQLKAFKGCEEYLDYLKKTGRRLYVYSDFPIGNKLDELGLEKYFDAAYSSEEAGFLKPDTRGFQFLKSKFEFEASRTLFVGDRDFTDVQFALNCLMRYARVAKDWRWC